MTHTCKIAITTLYTEVSDNRKIVHSLLSYNNLWLKHQPFPLSSIDFKLITSLGEFRLDNWLASDFLQCWQYYDVWLWTKNYKANSKSLTWWGVPASLVPHWSVALAAIFQQFLHMSSCLWFSETPPGSQDAWIWNAWSVPSPHSPPCWKRTRAMWKQVMYYKTGSYNCTKIKGKTK